MKKTTRFPLFVDMKDKPVLVFGGGSIAKRRIGVLLDFLGQKFRRLRLNLQGIYTTWQKIIKILS